MNIILMIFALLGGSADQKSFDPASMIAKHIIKGVYDEKRIQTLAVTKEKYAPNFMDKTRILE